jgi:trk system potassium uptake protein TrkA
MQVVIMGSGRTGSLLASMLDEAGHGVTVIDWEAEAFSRLPDTFSGRTVLGNAVDQDVMRLAEIEQADVFVAASSGDNRNIMASQIAQHVFQVPKVVCRIKDPIRADIYEGLGIQVDCRTTEGTQVLLELASQ